MKFYGIDAHSDMFKIEKNDLNGNRQISTIDINTPKFDTFLNQLNKDDYIALEASTNSFWFYDLVKDRVKDCLIINPWKFADIKNSFIKTDKRDARKIAKHLKYSVLFGKDEEQLPTVYVPKKEVRHIRSLFTTYQMYNKKKVMSKNRIHSLLKQNGISYKKSKTIFDKGLVGILEYDLNEEIIFQFELLFNEIKYLELQIKMIKDKILEKGKMFYNEIEILTSIKGISVFTAIAIMSDIVDIKRFSNAKKICSYLGLSPKIDSSNKTTRIGCLNRQSRKLSRTLLCQSVIHFYSASEYYEAFTKKIKSRKSAGKSKIAVIRKIITNIFRMLNDNKYFYGRNESNHLRKINKYNNFLKKIT